MHIRNIVPIVFAMITKLTERGTKRQLIIAVGVAAIMVIGIGSHTALAIKVGINQAAKHYDLSPLTSTLRLIDDIKKYNKIDGLYEFANLSEIPNLIVRPVN
ncbi:MAG: hypothetical protein ACJ709_00495 [Nitrososphaeraceae archaeon]